MNWNKRLTEARKQKNLSKSALAAAVGVSPSAITQWENGETKKIEGANLVRACAALGVSATWLLTGNPGEKDELEEAPAMVGTLKRLPVVGRVQAGPDGVLHVDDYASGEGDGYMVWWLIAIRPTRFEFVAKV